MSHYGAVVLLLGTMAIAAPTEAQTEAAHGIVAGIVVDSTTGRPVVAAQVSIVPGHATELTHSDGTFALGRIAPGRYTLTVERLGYRSWAHEFTVAPAVPTDLRIALEIAAVELGPIVVTGAVSARSRDETLSPVSTISGAELDRRSDQTIAAMIDGKAGVSITSLGPVTARPVIRGLGGDRILILEDGQRPGDLSSTSSDHAVAIEPLTAKQIEVVRGPMSLLYGSSALGGVVNVIRQEIPNAMPHEAHGAISIQGLSVNRGLTGGAWAETGVGALAARIEANARTSGDLRTPEGNAIHTGANTRDVALGAGVPSAHGHIGGSYRFYDNDYGIPGGFIGGHATGVDISMRRHTLRGQAAVHRDAGIVSSIELNAGYTRYHHEELEPSGALGTSFKQDLLQAEALARHRSAGFLREGAIGVRAQHRGIQTGGSLKTPSTDDWAVAGFLVEEFGGEVLRFQAGLRYDLARYIPQDTTAFVTAGGVRIPVRDRDFGSASGSFGALLTASPALRFGASVSRAFRTPDFNELYSNGPHLAANSFDVGDPQIEQETGLGFDFFMRVSLQRLHAEIATYRNTLDRYIFPSSRGRAELGAQGGRPRFQYTNEDARFTGFEGEIEASLSDLLTAEVSGSVVNARFTSDRDPIPVFDGVDTTFVPASQYPPLIPPPQMHIGLRADDPGRFAGIGLKLVAKQDRTGDFEAVTPGYALVDASLGIRRVRGSTLHTITVRIDNVFDTTYRDHLSRIKEILPGAGRGVSLLYRIVF